MVSKIINDWIKEGFDETSGMKNEVREKGSTIPQISNEEGVSQTPKPLFMHFTKGIKLEPDFLPENLKTIEEKFRSTASINLDEYASRSKDRKYSKGTSQQEITHIEYSRKNIYLSRVMFNLFEMPDSSVSKSSAEYQNVVERNELYQKALQKHKNFPENFIEKSFQTDVTDSIDKQIETIPIVMENKSCMVNNFLMKKHFERSEIKIKPPPKTFEEFHSSKTKFHNYEDFLNNIDKFPEISNRFRKALYVLEKTLNYNTFKSSILDYNTSMLKKYVNTTGKNEDSFEQSNSILLEKIDIRSHLFFHFQKMENNYQVTCIQCSEINPSIFIVGYGISKFRETDYDPRGMVLCWNIHKCGYPEKIYHTEEIVTCLEYSEAEPYLVAVGMRYGLVAIFDLRKSELYSSLNNYSSKMKPLGTIQNIRWTKKKYATGKETEVVLTVSMDGLICCWSRGRILDGHIMKYVRRGGNVTEQQRMIVAVDAVGMCMQMKPHSEDIFLIGTIEGQALQADLNDPDTYKYVYKCHNGVLYDLEWSPLVSDVFMTCGTDRFVHIWQEGKTKPSKTLVLEDVVLKVTWSYTKSTLFAALCEKRILFFDLTVDLHKEVAAFVAKKEVTFRYVTFCPKSNWTLVGQSDGVTTLLELTNVPSLRITQEEALRQNFLSD